MFLAALIQDPERELRRLCAHVGGHYSPKMLDYPSRPAPNTTGLGRTDDHLLRMPPTPGTRDWRAGLSRREQAAVEAWCRRELARFGFPEPTPPPWAFAYAFAVLAWRKIADQLAAGR